MRKLTTAFTAASISLIATGALANNSLSGTSYYAPSSSYQDGGQFLPEPVLKHKNDNQRYRASSGFYFKASGTYTYMKLPGFKFGNQVGETTFGTTTKKKFDFSNRINTVMPELQAGKYFYNNRFLPFLFGQTAHIAIKGFYVSDTNKESIENAGSALLWNINGNGEFTRDGLLNNLENVDYHAKHRLKQIGLYFGGTHAAQKFGGVEISRSLTFGVFYQNLNQRYSLSGLIVNKFDSVTYPSKEFNLNENVDTDYWGGGINNTIYFKFNPVVTSFIEGDINLVSAKANFTGHENIPNVVPGSLPPIIGDVSNSTSKLTYQATVAGGMLFHVPNFPLNVELKGGVNFYGFVPEIFNPDAATGGQQPTQVEGTARVVGTTAINPFGTISLILPF